MTKKEYSLAAKKAWNTRRKNQQHTATPSTGLTAKEVKHYLKLVDQLDLQGARTIIKQVLTLFKK